MKSNVTNYLNIIYYKLEEEKRVSLGQLLNAMLQKPSWFGSLTRATNGHAMSLPT